MIAKTRSTKAYIYRDKSNRVYNAAKAHHYRPVEKTTTHQHARMRYHSGMWKVKSKGAVLTLILHYFVSCSSVVVCLLYSETHSGPGRGLHWPLILGAGMILLTICSPIAGWLADIHFGRYKVLQFGLCCMWIASSIVTAAMLVGHELGGCQKCKEVVYDAGWIVGIALFSIGLAAYAVNAIQFGIDQMPDASSDELSAYIHWFVWVIIAGDLTAKLAFLVMRCVPVADDDYVATPTRLMLPNVMLSLALCCMFMLNGWFIKEPGSSNSLTTVLKVLKFAATHKYPVRRRAITYCEDERPSRIDFAKDKYGGPFTTEQVEDVKTLFRMAMVIALSLTLTIPLGLLGLSPSELLVFNPHHECTLVNMLINKLSSYLLALFVVTIIPLYTFIIYPLVRRRMLTILQRVVLAATLMVILTGAMLTEDSIKHALNPHLSCMFSTSSSAHVMKSEFWVVILFNLSLAIGVVLWFTAVLEFCCAQSPYSMRGLLTGLVFTIFYFTLIVAFGINAAWKKFHRQIPPSCDFYYFLFLFLCAVVGLIVIGITAKWYKRRRRQEEDDQRRIVEAIYDRMLNVQSATGNNEEED